MITDIRFLTLLEVLEIHNMEIQKAGGLDGIRDLQLLESAVWAPKTMYDELIAKLFMLTLSFISTSSI